MKLSEISTPELRRILKATRQAAGDDSVEAMMLRRELVRRASPSVARRKGNLPKAGKK